MSAVRTRLVAGTSAGRLDDLKALAVAYAVPVQHLVFPVYQRRGYQQDGTGGWS
jgi:hypothetical protein